MSTDAKVYVKRGGRLIIDNTLVTNACGDRWTGIEVWGKSDVPQPSNPYSSLDGDDPGVLVIQNGSVIEHATTAIMTLTHSQPWPQFKEYYGGVVIIEDSEFTNNRRAIEFMQYGYENQSRIINSVFQEDGQWSNGTTGITIWACKGIEFEGNQFIGFDWSGIAGIDFESRIVDYNRFTGCYRGIESYATYPQIANALIIGELGSDDNYFESNNLHILCESAALQGLRVSNNTFDDASVSAIWIDGESGYIIDYNNFTNSFAGVATWNTGIHHNYVSCNNAIDDIDYGLGVFGMNGLLYTGLQFRGNEYATDEADILITTDGLIDGSVKKFVLQANNCFNSEATDIIADQNETINFYYYCDLSQNADPCVVPKNNLSDNGNNNYYLRPNADYVCLMEDFPDPPYDEDDLENIRDSIASIGTPTTAAMQTKLAYFYEYKDIVFDYLLIDAVTNKDWSSAEQYLLDENTYSSSKLLYGIKVDQQDWTDAEAILGDLPTNTQDEEWFVEVQEINLQRLQEGNEFELSQPQEELLYEVSESLSKERSYARSLLMLLRGERFEVNFNGESGVVDPRSSEEVNMGLKDVLIYPNPVNQEITVKFTNIPQFTAVRLVSPDGSTIRAVEILPTESSQITLDVSTIGPGVYFVQCWSYKQLVHSEKVVVLH
jgi:hypothetical protein